MYRSMTFNCYVNKHVQHWRNSCIRMPQFFPHWLLCIWLNIWHFRMELELEFILFLFVCFLLSFSFFSFFFALIYYLRHHKIVRPFEKLLFEKSGVITKRINGKTYGTWRWTTITHSLYIYYYTCIQTSRKIEQFYITNLRCI